MKKTADALPAYESEIKECDDLFNCILRYIKKQEGYDVDDPLLRKAYETAKRLHGDVRRHSGVLYLRHPLAVMESDRLVFSSRVVRTYWVSSRSAGTPAILRLPRVR